jgi:hypothetical protein
MQHINPLQEIDQQVEHLRTRERELTAERDTVRQELAAADAAVGDSYLDNPNVAAVTKCSTDLRTHVAVLEKAGFAARNRRFQLILARRKAEAAQLRIEAQTKRAEQHQINGQTAKHLAALSNLEGIEFTSWILRSQPAPDCERFSATGDVPQDQLGPADINWGPRGPAYLVPRSRILSQTIRELEARAGQLETAPVADFGVADIDATGAEDVIRGVLAQDKITPSIDAIRAWLDAVQRKAERPFGDAPRRVRVVWKGGEIDREQSYVQMLAWKRKPIGSSVAETGDKQAPSEPYYA